MDIVLITGEQLKSIIVAAVHEAIGTSPQAAPVPESNTLLSRKEAAERLKISLVTLNDWSKRGLIPSYIIGGKVFYKEMEIEQSLHKVKTAN